MCLTIDTHRSTSAALVLLTLLPFAAHAQLETTWAHTVVGGAIPWFDYWHDANTCAVDPWGNLVVNGYIGSEPLSLEGDDGALAVPPAIGGDAGDMYLARYRNDGTPSWGFRLGSAAFDASIGVAMDAHGCAYLAGMFEGPMDVDPGPDTVLLTPADGDRDLMVATYDSTGHFLRVLQLVSDYVNPTAGQITRMGFDAANNLYIGGYFRGHMDVDGDTSAVVLTGNGGHTCAFVAKYDTQGHLLQHLVLPANSGPSKVMDLVVRPDGSFFIVGEFDLGIDMDPGPGTWPLTGSPNRTSYIALFDTEFQLHWARTFESTTDHSAFVACSGINGGVVVGGQFRGDITIPLLSGEVLSFNGGFNTNDAYITGLDANGAFLWFKPIVTSEVGYVEGLSAKEDGTVYLHFSFTSDIDLDAGASDFTLSAPPFPNYEMGLARYRAQNGTFLMGHAFAGSGVNYNDIELLGSTMYMTGTYTGSLNVDIPPGPDVLTSGGLAVIKYCHMPDQLGTSLRNDTLVLCADADTLITASGADGYAWYDVAAGGAPIATGDTLHVLGADGPGTIYLEGINATCRSQRIPITIAMRPQWMCDPTTGTMAAAAPDQHLQAFPIPANDRLLVTTDMPSHRPSGAELLDLMGRRMGCNANKEADRITLDVRGLSAGAYVLRILFVNGTVRTRQVLIAH